jgi:hypothetical protein
MASSSMSVPRFGRRDGSFVACLDKSDRDRVRDNFLKKKLALSLSDTELDRDKPLSGCRASSRRLRWHRSHHAAS